MTNPISDAAATRCPAPLPKTKKQTTASLLASGLAGRARWKVLIEAASTTWPQISAAELATSGGNKHALAGLVQLRQRVSRAESDEQVGAFFAAHPAPEQSPPQKP